MNVRNNTNASNFSASIRDRMLALNIQPTLQRCEIAGVLFSQHHHLSAQQVLNTVNANGGHVSRATVYNTLNLFVKKGLIRQVIIDPTKVFYDSNTSRHFHFYNEDTGELLDIDPDDMKIHIFPALPENTINSGVDVIIRVKDSP